MTIKEIKKVIDFLKIDTKFDELDIRAGNRTLIISDIEGVLFEYVPDGFNLGRGSSTSPAIIVKSPTKKLIFSFNAIMDGTGSIYGR